MDQRMRELDGLLKLFHEFPIVTTLREGTWGGCGRWWSPYCSKNRNREEEGTWIIERYVPWAHCHSHQPRIE